jgi:septal ring factor EnvC (AmiA/AmiB activator)
MPVPKLNGKHGELITKMYGKIGVLITDVANIKDSQKELRKDVSKIYDSITELKVNTKGSAEKLKALSDDLDEHKKEHERLFSKVLGIIGIITTIVSLAVSVIYNLFKR